MEDSGKQRRNDTLFDRILGITSAVGIVMIMFTMLAICAHVGMRYIFGKPLNWVIDVARGGLDSVMAFKFYEVAKYIIKPGFGSAPASLFLNLKKWESIPKNLQDLLVNSLYEMAPASEAKHTAMINGAFKVAQKKGMKVIEFQGADREYFNKTIEDALYKYASKDSPENARKVYELTHK